MFPRMCRLAPNRKMPAWWPSFQVLSLGSGSTEYHSWNAEITPLWLHFHLKDNNKVPLEQANCPYVIAQKYLCKGLTFATRKSDKIPLPPKSSRPNATVSLARKVFQACRTKKLDTCYTFSELLIDTSNPQPWKAEIEAVILTPEWKV
jgi:hypothetical protein